MRLNATWYHTLGLLMGAAGVGAGISALSMAVRKSVRGLYDVIPLSAALMGGGLIGFSFSHNFWLSIVLIAVAGFGMMQAYAASSTVIQTVVEDDKRGRVISYWAMAYMGATPLGSLLAGCLAPVIGAPGTVLLCGVGCIAGAVWFSSQLLKLRPVINPIFQRLGVLPAIPAESVAAEEAN